MPTTPPARIRVLDFWVGPLLGPTWAPPPDRPSGLGHPVSHKTGFIQWCWTPWPPSPWTILQNPHSRSRVLDLPILWRLAARAPLPEPYVTGIPVCFENKGFLVVVAPCARKAATMPSTAIGSHPSPRTLHVWVQLGCSYLTTSPILDHQFLGNKGFPGVLDVLAP